MPDNERDRISGREFSRRVVLTLLIVSIFLFLLLVAGWASHILLVIFGGMLTATFVRSLTLPRGNGPGCRTRSWSPAVILAAFRTLLSRPAFTLHPLSPCR